MLRAAKAGDQMTGKVFISNRRKGATEGFAHALFNRLEQAFPPKNLFMDVEGGIRAGQDFVRVLEQEVSACDVMLVLIGPDWLTVTDEAGRPRFENPEDFVRIEVGSALRLDKWVIPVLVQKAEMPRAADLPEPIKALARRHAVGLTPERFKADAQGLIRVLEDALAEVEEARSRAATAAEAAEKRRSAEEAAKADEVARAEKERARLEAIAGLSPDQIAKAEELVNWDFIKEGKSSDEFRDHLARFPQGVTKGLARSRLEAFVWDALPRPINTAALKGFLEEFPKGARAGEANAKLPELEAQAAGAREAAKHENRTGGQPKSFQQPPNSTSWAANLRKLEAQEAAAAREAAKHQQPPNSTSWEVYLVPVCACVIGPLVYIVIHIIYGTFNDKVTQETHAFFLLTSILNGIISGRMFSKYGSFRHLRNISITFIFVNYILAKIIANSFHMNDDEFGQILAAGFFFSCTAFGLCALSLLYLRRKDLVKLTT
jgi:hypothetical protein